MRTWIPIAVTSLFVMSGTSPDAIAKAVSAHSRFKAEVVKK